ncbi:hypothetical protein [Flagellimonas pacifica]|uniref:Uncharacterized protein n=1 Tax=Flagellimonas pacifica TaxID=1247520 RepID=A0A285MFJ3_9FLAO|nr:hypothetical protein [Allomuricauda parva]SNY94726.1 hypothetical protein SAMN06265377_0386 [Allomuricauda parva]
MEDSDDPKTNFQELATLSENMATLFLRQDFIIEGNPDYFNIKVKKDLFLLLIFPILFLITFPSIIINSSNLGNPKFWIMEISITAIAISLLKFYATSKNIVVDTNKKTIVIKNLNIFKRPTSKPKNILFKEFDKFRSEAISATVGRFGHRVQYQKIHISYADKETFLLDLTYHPEQLNSHKIFMARLGKIIKHTI